MKKRAVHVVVTGASSGIGEGLVRAYAAEGAAITMIARRKEKMEAIANELSCPTHIVSKDLSDLDTCGDWLDGAIERFGAIDIFINNAGVQIVALFQDTGCEEATKLLRLDLDTPLRLLQLVVPGMLERGKGTIVNVSSMAGLVRMPGMAFYSAAKAGLAAASEVLHAELRKTGVHVVTVYPGPVATPMAEAAEKTLGEFATQSFVSKGDTTTLAKRIMRAVTTRRHRVIYPRVYGLSVFFPTLTRWLLDRFAPLPPAKSRPTNEGEKG